MRQHEETLYLKGSGNLGKHEAAWDIMGQHGAARGNTLKDSVSVVKSGAI